MQTKAEKYKAQQKQAKKFKTVPHRFEKKVCHWSYCSGCGLVMLRNDASRKAAARGCESMELT